MNKLSIEICERIKSVIGDSKVGLHEPIFNSLEKENLSNQYKKDIDQKLAGISKAEKETANLKKDIKKSQKAQIEF